MACPGRPWNLSPLPEDEDVSDTGSLIQDASRTIQRLTAANAKHQTRGGGGGGGGGGALTTLDLCHPG